MLDSPSGTLALTLLLALAVGAWAGLAVRRSWRALLLRVRMRRARRREALAEALLERAGYTVLGAQLTATCPLLLDGERLEPTVRADYLVARRGRTYVAEAKSGPRATDPTDRATRRQLLEYALAYEADGVLLVDTEAGIVRTVEFPALRGAAPWPTLLGAVGLGAILGAALSRALG